MSSSKRMVSVNEQESSRESVSFEELVEWKGPVSSVGWLGASMQYLMEGEDFYFLLIDEDDISSGLAYRRPGDEYAPDRKESKILDYEEKDELKILQYKTIVSES